jgi:hypothetical protein
MTDRLSIYNGALMLCGERFLASLTEEREPRRLLDRVWDSNGVKTCLEMGQWNFAMRATQVDYDPGISPSFGYIHAFEKPTDWVLTSGLCTDERFQEPLTQYIDETGYWYADLDTIYLRYVSSDVAYGLDFAAWPESFREYVEEYFASKIIRKLTSSEDEERKSFQRLRMKLSLAKNKAAMTQPTAFPPQGSWGRARNRNWGGRGNGNSSGNLIG